ADERRIRRRRARQPGPRDRQRLALSRRGDDGGRYACLASHAAARAAGKTSRRPHAGAGGGTTEQVEEGVSECRVSLAYFRLRASTMHRTVALRLIRSEARR